MFVNLPLIAEVGLLIIRTSKGFLTNFTIIIKLNIT